MNKIRLFINSEEIEINEQSIFAITKEYENLTDPTTISNDWTKTVEIPATQHNTKVFGNIFRADRVDTAGNGDTGLYFNAHKKLDAMLMYGADVLLSGYAKMTSIKRKNGKITYSINLFGMLGKVFDIMSKITFYPTEGEDDLYYIDGSKYVDEVINKNLVYNLWNTDQGLSYGIPLSDATTADIIGFTPVNAYATDFDATTYQKLDGGTISVAESLTKTWEANELDTNYDTDSIVGDGLLPRSVNDFRSYYQLPFIFFNKFFDIFKEKFEEVSDYTLDMDYDWKYLQPDKLLPMFGRKVNPYWGHLVFLGKQLYNSGETTVETHQLVENGQYVFGISNPLYYKTGDLGPGMHTYWNAGLREKQTISFSTTSTEYYDAVNNRFLLQDDKNIHISGTLKYGVRSNRVTGSESIRFYNNSLLQVFVVYTGQNGHQETTSTILARDKNKYHLDEKYANVVFVGNMGLIQQGILGWDFNINIDRYLQKAVFGDYVTLEVYVKWGEYYPDIQRIMNTSDPFYINSARSDDRYTTMVGLGQGSVLSFDVVSKKNRSYDHITLNDLWDREVRPFDFLLRYCKMFGLLFKVNDFDKTITIMHRSKYFSDYTVSDWTDKLDMSQDYELKPASFEHKYMLFNYDESDVANAKNYKEKYGVEYGSLKVDTSYAFDNETEDLFDGIRTSLTYTPTVLMHENMLAQQFIFNGLSDVMINISDKDNNAIEDVFGQFYFYLGNAFWDEHVYKPYVSDDTPIMNIQDDYMYVAKYYVENGVNYTAVTDMYSKLDVNFSRVIGGTGIPQPLWRHYNYLCLFNTPKETYDTTNTYKYENSIYDIYWKKYVNEIYNNANNVLTCYLKITPTDYCNFDFNKFIVIDKVLYRINKIFDYSPNNLTTKCELVQISDIEAYSTITDPVAKPNSAPN